YAPVPRAEFSLAAAREAATRRPAQPDPTATARRDATAASTVIFPSEHLDECGVDGARRVLSPLFPAADPFRRLVVSHSLDADAGERGEWVRAVEGILHHRTLSSTDSHPSA
ncbi:MAG TPA: hypothetical protein VFH88_12630, partial [Candidatus Krumholzibacteria bacterium]|nr:hypothetical protein [Candidatus Krumholzibacteria bacterium]